MENKNKLTTLCGLDCLNCEFNEKNLTNEIALINEIKYGITREELVCKGCDLLRNDINLHSDSFECCNMIQAKKYCSVFLSPTHKKEKELVL